jgi:hypothetical protein
MKIVRFAVLGLAPLLALSCSSIAPVKINAGDQCFRCRRTISDTRMAAETIQGGFVSKYRAAGCMAKYIVAHPDEQTGTMFVTDFAKGTMINPATAFFVPVTVDSRSGETDYQAYSVKADADAAAADLKTAAVDWATVLDKAR